MTKLLFAISNGTRTQLMNCDADTLKYIASAFTAGKKDPRIHELNGIAALVENLEEPCDVKLIVGASAKVTLYQVIQQLEKGTDATAIYSEITSTDGWQKFLSANKAFAIAYASAVENVAKALGTKLNEGFDFTAMYYQNLYRWEITPTAAFKRLPKKVKFIPNGQKRTAARGWRCDSNPGLLGEFEPYELNGKYYVDRYIVDENLGRVAIKDTANKALRVDTGKYGQADWLAAVAYKFYVRTVTSLIRESAAEVQQVNG